MSTKKMLPLKKITKFIVSFFLLTQPLFVFGESVEDNLYDHIMLIDIPETEATDCSTAGGERTHIQNLHKEHILDARVDRYFQTVRQAGRSVIILKPEEIKPLGCNIALGAEQYWKIVDVRIVKEIEY